MTRQVLTLVQKIALNDYLKTVLQVGEDGLARYPDGMTDGDVARFHGCQPHHVQGVRNSVYGKVKKSPKEAIDVRMAKLEARLAKLERMLAEA